MSEIWSVPVLYVRLTTEQQCANNRKKAIEDKLGVLDTNMFHASHKQGRCSRWHSLPICFRFIFSLREDL